MARYLEELGLARQEAIEVPVWGEDEDGRGKAKAWLELNPEHRAAAGYKLRSDGVEAMLDLLARFSQPPALAWGWLEKLSRLSQSRDGVLIPRQTTQPLDISSPSRGIRSIIFKGEKGWVCQVINLLGEWSQIASLDTSGLSRQLNAKEVYAGNSEWLSPHRGWVINLFPTVKLPGLNPGGELKRSRVVRSSGRDSAGEGGESCFIQPAFCKGWNMPVDSMDAAAWRSVMSRKTTGGLSHRLFRPRQDRCPEEHQLFVTYRPHNPYRLPVQSD